MEQLPVITRALPAKHNKVMALLSSQPVYGGRQKVDD
jgi:hypothetical protein